MNGTALNLTQGIIEGLPFEKYLAIPAASSGFLRGMQRSPAHAFVREESQALDFGGLFDDFLFETNAKKHFLAAKIDGRTKAGKLAHAARQVLINQGMTPVSADDYDRLHAMLDAVKKSRVASYLIDGRTQVTAIWQDEETGCWCKARADVLRDDIATIVDVKTTHDASPDAFARSTRRYGYEIQLAYYMDGFRACGVELDKAAFVACESGPPFGVACYELPTAALESGQEAYKRLLRVYAECLKTNHWPAYPDGLNLLPWRDYDRNRKSSAGADNFAISFDGD